LRKDVFDTELAPVMTAVLLVIETPPSISSIAAALNNLLARPGNRRQPS
jgi:hypothetical protein